METDNTNSSPSTSTSNSLPLSSSSVPNSSSSPFSSSKNYNPSDEDNQNLKLRFDKTFKEYRESRIGFVGRYESPISAGQTLKTVSLLSGISAKTTKSSYASAASSILSYLTGSAGEIAEKQRHWELILQIQVGENIKYLVLSYGEDGLEIEVDYELDRLVNRRNNNLHGSTYENKTGKELTLGDLEEFVRENSEKQYDIVNYNCQHFCLAIIDKLGLTETHRERYTPFLVENKGIEQEKKN